MLREEVRLLQERMERLEAQLGTSSSLPVPAIGSVSSEEERLEERILAVCCHEFLSSKEIARALMIRDYNNHRLYQKILVRLRNQKRLLSWQRSNAKSRHQQRYKTNPENPANYHILLNVQD